MSSNAPFFDFKILIKLDKADNLPTKFFCLNIKCLHCGIICECESSYNDIKVAYEAMTEEASISDNEIINDLEAMLLVFPQITGWKYHGLIPINDNQCLPFFICPECFKKFQEKIISY